MNNQISLLGAQVAKTMPIIIMVLYIAGLVAIAIITHKKSRSLSGFSSRTGGIGGGWLFIRAAYFPPLFLSVTRADSACNWGFRRYG